MRIDYLYYFLDFAKTKSITRTAANYYMTPQGISRAIHQLEKDFGVIFFTRKGNNTYLTEAGKQFESNAYGIVERYEEAKKAIMPFAAKQDSQADDNCVYISTTACASKYVLSLLNLTKSGLFPFTVRLRETDIHRIFPRISEPSRMVLGLISLPMTQKYISLLNMLISDNELIYKSFMCSPLSVIAADDSAFAQKSELKTQEIKNMPVVCYKNAVLIDALDDFVREDNLISITNTEAVLNSQLVDGHMIAFAPLIADFSDSVPKGTRIVPFEENDGFFETSFGFLLTPHAYEDERVQLVMNYVEDTFHKLSESVHNKRHLKSGCGKPS